MRRSVCLAAVGIAVPNVWPVLEVLALLPLLPAELPWVSPTSGACAGHQSRAITQCDTCRAAAHVHILRFLASTRRARQFPTEVVMFSSNLLPHTLQVPAAMRSAAGNYSGLIGGITLAQRLAGWLLPDVTRTLRMWRQFLPIYVRCKWTAWRYQESKGHSARVHTSSLTSHSALIARWTPPAARWTPPAACMCWLLHPTGNHCIDRVVP